MACGILIQERDEAGQLHERACFYDTTTRWAFGPVADDLDRFSTPSQALRAFEVALGGDPRAIGQGSLEVFWGRWLAAAREAIPKFSILDADDVISEKNPDGSWTVRLTDEAQAVRDDHDR